MNDKEYIRKYVKCFIFEKTLSSSETYTLALEIFFKTGYVLNRGCEFLMDNSKIIGWLENTKRKIIENYENIFKKLSVKQIIHEDIYLYYSTETNKQIEYTEYEEKYKRIILRK